MCSCGHVECSFDNPARTFPVEIQVYLIKFPKRRETIVEKFFPWNSVFSTLRLLFWNPWQIFVEIIKKVTQYLEKNTKSIIYLLHLFLKVLIWTDCCNAFLASLPNTLRQKFNFSAQRLKMLNQLLLLPWKSLNRQLWRKSSTSV